MKKKLLLVLLLTPVMAVSQVLFDQTTGEFGSGCVSQDFETANNAYDSEAADDFIVPSGQTWTVDSVFAVGSYSSGAQTSTPIRMVIYTDSGGAPHQVYEEFEWTTDQDGNGDGDVMMAIPCELRLTAGRYWLSVIARKDFSGGSGGQWFWSQDSIGAGEEFVWRNAGNGFASGCTAFSAASTCVSSYTGPGTAFIIYGCAGGPNIAAFPSDTTVCSADSLILTADNGGLNNATFAWSSGDSTQSLQISESGLYNVSVTDPNTGCHGVACIDVTVNETPTPSLANDTICQGNSANFNGFANCGTCTYTWNDSVNGAFYSTGDPGWHYLEVVNPATGCSSYDSVWLEVESTDPPELAPGLEVDLCEGDSVYLSVVNVYAGYDWSSGETTQGIYAYTGGDYAVTVTTPNGCEAFDTIVVSERPAPVPSIVLDYTNNWKTRLTASAGYQTYQWSNGESDPVTIADSDGDFTVTVTDEFGCEGTATISVTIIPAGVANPEVQGLEVYPNPASDLLVIEWDASQDEATTVSMVDVTGKTVVRPQPMTSSRLELPITELSAGIYLLHIRQKNAHHTLRVVKH